MVERHPIINFEPREYDTGITPGGGSSQKPKWVLSDEALQERIMNLASDIDEINKDWSINDQYGIPKAIKVEFIEKAKAKSHQSKIINVFTVNDDTKQIAMASEYSIVMKVKTIQELEIIKSHLTDEQRNDVQISAITGINEFEPIFETKSGNTKYKLSVLDFLDYDENQSSMNYIENKFRENNLDYKIVKYGMKNVIELQESNFDKLTFIRNLPIKSFEPMEETSPFRISGLEFGEEDRSPFIQYDSEKKYPVIGLLDSGVTINRYTSNWVRRGEGSRYLDDELNTGHGTYIASLLIHGDQLNGFSDSSTKGCRIIDVPVVPRNSITGPELITNIENAILSNPEVKIWNLSVSLADEIHDDRFSDFSIELDRIQDTYKVLIFKSAGNDTAFYHGGEAGKLNVGAESVRSVTIGSMNRASDKYGFSVENYPSPYSRKGRGPASIVKPELSFYGGDVFANKLNPVATEDFEIIGEKGYGADGEVIRQIGTSFSTPKVAKTAAELALFLDEEEFNPLLIKALLIHSASFPKNVSLSDKEKSKKLGFGKPCKASTILSDDNYSSTLLLQGTLEKKKNIDIMDFPYPKNLVEDGKFKGQITATLVYSPYLEGELGSEYCQSNLTLRIGTYDEQSDRENKFAIFNPIKKEGAQNILVHSIYSTRKMKQNIQFGKEQVQIEYGDKYYPVKKYSCDLKDLRPAAEKHLDSDKRWYLFLEGQYRDFIQKKLESLDERASMDYCLLITITDSESSIDVHQGTIQSLETNNFNYNEISTQVEVQVDTDIDLNEN